MGKSVPRGVKTRSDKLIELFKEKLSTDYEKNKAFINKMELPVSKTTRNLLAGYITRRMNELNSN